MKLVYTDEAIEDLKHLREFISVHNPSAAASIAAELRQQNRTITGLSENGVTG